MATRAQIARCSWAALNLAALLVLTACGGGGGNGGNGMPTPTPANRPPTFTSTANVSVPEETAGVFHTVTGSDPDGDMLTFSIGQGSDGTVFRLTSAGALSFASPPDFEVPIDSNRDNVYIVPVTVSDGRATATQNLSVTVTDRPNAAFRVRRVAAGLNQPVFLTAVPDNTGRVFVVELTGRILIMTPATGAVAPTPFLDVTGQISTDGERGLLGFAPAPDFTSSGRFYVYLTVPDGTIELRRYQTLAGSRDRADPATADAILRIPHPRSNHNGGWIAFNFGDGMLYIGVGDGGGAGDPDNNGQNRNTLLGKILRIDPSADAFPADPDRDYRIPVTNPFAGGGGAPEVWAYGLRNPFRAGFDAQTSALWIGDVGQNAVEEIDVIPSEFAGLNFGWPILEGTVPFRGGSTAGLEPPVAQYRHCSGPTQGNTMIGGYVYRGPVEALRGHYIFADFVTPNIWSFPITRVSLGTTLEATDFIQRNADFAPGAGAYNNIVSFGQDQSLNLYILDLDGEIFVIEPTPVGTATAAASAATRVQSAATPRADRTQRGGRREDWRR